eukprot:g8693.t1
MLIRCHGCSVLEEEKADLENQISSLQQQVKILTEKLQEVGGEQAVLEVQEKIKLVVPVVRRKKKKQRAYERLWQDAQRRIITMRVQAKMLEKTQEEQLASWRKSAVVSDKSMKIIQNMSRMHRDATTSQRELSQAMEDYNNDQEPADFHDVWDEDEEDDSPSSGIQASFPEFVTPARFHVVNANGANCAPFRGEE